MKRLKSKAGFTLMELIVTMLVLVILTAGIIFSMDAGAKIYQKSIFESHSALLEDTLNNSLSDILRNSTKAWVLTPAEKENVYPDDVNYAFNNSDYDANSAYIYAVDDVLKIFSSGVEGTELVNTGTYPDLKVENLDIQLVAQGAATATDGSQYGGYFTISYRITSTKNASLTRDVTTVVRLLNNP